MNEINSKGVPPVSRRKVVVGIGGIFGAGVTAESARSTPTPGTDSEQQQIFRKAVIPDVGQPFSGNYVGQFLLITDPTPRMDVSPDVIADCEFSDWAPGETRTIDGLLVDRLSDDSVQMVVQTFLNGNLPNVRAGTEFIINRVHQCPDRYLGLELEQVPVRTFAPEYGTIDHPLVAESPGPTVEQPEDDGSILESPGQPGFGVVATLMGISLVALLRRFWNQ